MRRLLPALLLGLLACAGPDDGPEAATGAGGLQLTGADGRAVTLDAPATRVVSLVPAVGEIIVALGAAERVVGRTEYDTAPELSGLPSVGGGIGADLEALAVLDPDLVIRFEGPSDQRTANGLDALGIPHLGIRTDRIADVLDVIRTVGRAVGEGRAADSLVSRLDAGLDSLRRSAAALDTVPAAFLLGGSPALAAGAGTYLDELMTLGAGRNAYRDLGDLYAPVSSESLLAREIDVLLTTRGADLDPRIHEGRRLQRVSGDVLIPGASLLDAAWEVARALHPGIQR